MKILVTGGTGFIGTLLCSKLLADDHQLTVYTRNPAKVRGQGGDRIGYVTSLDNLAASECFDAIINLAGEPIADKRWSEKRKLLLLDSRLKTTQGLLDFVARTERKPVCLISGSAVGFYGDQGDTQVNELTTPYPDFGHRLCCRWENLARLAEEQGLRVCIVRTGLVVGSGGGFLKRMLPPFKLGLGGPMGSGQQWMSWIHIEDLVELFIWLLKHETCQGVFNGTAPNPVTNREFSKTLAACLHRPALLPVPSLMLRIALGEMSGLLLTGQRVNPERALEGGFEFRFPHLQQALSQVVSPLDS